MKRRRHRACLICHRKLSDRLSRSRGYGPVCYGKRPDVQMKVLESVGQMRLFE